MIEPTIDAFTTSWRPSLEREEGDDQLGRVAERDVQEAADAGAGLARRAARSPRPSAAAVGITPSAAAPKISAAAACASSSATATGMKTPRQ